MLEYIGGTMLRWVEWMSRDRDAVSNSIALCSQSSVLWDCSSDPAKQLYFSPALPSKHAKQLRWKKKLTALPCGFFFPECTCTMSCKWNETLKVPQTPIETPTLNKSDGGGDVLIRWKSWQRKLQTLCEQTQIYIRAMFTLTHKSRLICYFIPFLFKKRYHACISAYLLFRTMTWLRFNHTRYWKHNRQPPFFHSQTKKTVIKRQTASGYDHQSAVNTLNTKTSLSSTLTVAHETLVDKQWQHSTQYA